MEDGIGIRLTESGDSFVFREHGSERCPQTLALSNRSKGRHLSVLIVVKHRHFGLASPTPKHFHDDSILPAFPRLGSRTTVETSLFHSLAGVGGFHLDTVAVMALPSIVTMMLKGVVIESWQLRGGGVKETT